MEKEAYKDGQIWEKDNLLLQVSLHCNKYFVAAFRNTGDDLVYIGSIIFSDATALKTHLEKKEMNLTDKVITLCRKTQ
jgi:hypothetical protein